MKTCYHFTNKAQLEQILSEGLKPKYGINSQLISDSREEKVYYSVGEEATIDIYVTFNEIIGRVLDGRIKPELYKTYSDELKQKLKTARDMESWIGEGIYLAFDGSTLKNSNENVPKDSYTTDTIPPENLYVCVLIDETSNKIVSAKSTDIVTYFIAKRTTNFDEVLDVAGFFALDIEEKVEKFRNMALTINYIPLTNYYNLFQIDMYEDPKRSR